MTDESQATAGASGRRPLSGAILDAIQAAGPGTVATIAIYRPSQLHGWECNLSTLTALGWVSIHFWRWWTGRPIPHLSFAEREGR